MTTTATFVQLPTDSGNTGKKTRTVSRTVGADSVHSTFIIMDSTRDYTGVYGAHTGNHTISATAQNGTATGFIWFINPIGSTVTVALSRLRYMSSIVTSLSTPTCPRIVAQLFTYTGTPSGAVITPGKFKSAYATAQASIRTAVTGMTVVLGGQIDSFLPPVAVGTAAWATATPSSEENIANSELSDIQLAAGEGIVIYQADAGTTSDTRKLVINIAWSEFT